MNVTKHMYPNIRQERIQQITAVVLIVIMLLVAAALFVLAVMLGAGLFAVMALLVLLLIAPVVMLLVNTPPAVISEEGLRLLTMRGEILVSWQQITAIRRYPLLPTPEQESGRRLLLGRAKYTPAQGIMLIIPGLPLVYRIAGLLANAGGMPVVTFTNRTHTEYETLVKRIYQYAGHAVHQE